MNICIHETTQALLQKWLAVNVLWYGLHWNEFGSIQQMSTWMFEKMNNFKGSIAKDQLQ